MSHPNPSHGGSFIRDPRTGELKPEIPAEPEAIAPDEPQPVAADEPTPKGGK